MTQGAPEAGREVGLMYSFSSQSDDDFSPLETAAAGKVLKQTSGWDCFWCCLKIRFSDF